MFTEKGNLILPQLKKKVGEKKKRWRIYRDKNQSLGFNILITPHDLEENHQSELISGTKEERTKEYRKRLYILRCVKIGSNL